MHKILMHRSMFIEILAYNTEPTPVVVEFSVLFLTYLIGCVCKFIARALQHLNTLCLSYHRICPDMFVGRSQAQYIAINMCRNNLGPFVRPCGSIVTWRNLSWENRIARAWNDSDEAVRLITVDLKEKIIIRDAFPKLCELRLIVPHRTLAQNQHLVTVHKILGTAPRTDHIETTNFVSNTFQISKSADIQGSLLDSTSFSVSNQQSDVEQRTQTFSLFPQSDCTIRSLLQGSCAWYEDPSGAKHPPPAREV